MALKEADARLLELNEEIARLLKERENVLKEWNTAFNAENPEDITCIDDNIDDIVHYLYLVNGDFKMHVCIFDDYDMKRNITDFYKRVDTSMQMLNMANKREFELPDYQKNLVYAKAAEIREKFMEKVEIGKTNMILKPNIGFKEAVGENCSENKEIIISEDFYKNPLNFTVAEILIKHVINNQNNPMVTYKQLAAKISSDFNPRNLGGYLGCISDECKENGLPLISSIVVNQDSGLPGEGFFNYYYKERPMSDWEKIFEECKSDVINCTLWQDLLDAVIKTK